MFEKLAEMAETEGFEPYPSSPFKFKRFLLIIPWKIKGFSSLNVGWQIA